MIIELTTVIALVASMATAAWAVSRRRAARKDRDDAAIKDLYDHYLVGIDALTQAYLLRAPSDEEWLAGIEARAGKPGPARQAETPDYLRPSAQDHPGARRSRRRSCESGLGAAIIAANFVGIGMAAAYVLGHLTGWLLALLTGVPMALGFLSLAEHVLDSREELPSECRRRAFWFLGAAFRLPQRGIYDDRLGSG